MPSIQNTPLEDWTDGWLKMETASLCGDALFIMLTDKEKREAGLPVTREEMIAYIKGHRNAEGT